MRRILLVFFGWSIFFAVSCTRENTRVKNALAAVERDQRMLLVQMEQLSRRLMVLESALGGARKPFAPEGGRRTSQVMRELSPEELPTVTLRPPEPVSPPPVPRRMANADPDAYADEPEGAPDADEPPPPGARRVVLKMEGTPSAPGGQDDAGSGGKPLPLGKFAPLREPDDSSPAVGEPSRLAVPANAKLGADALYRTAMEHYEAGQHALALTLFSRLEKEHPAHALAANAVFWQGECHFQMGRFDLAAVLYQRVVEKYPRSPKIPDAMYKWGVSLDKTGNPVRARELLARVMELVPQTPLAAKAAVYLQKMR